MFAKDRDLLVLEPNLFRDVGWAAQRLLSVTGSISGTTLTVLSGDLAAAGIEGGHVAVVDGVALEVIERLSATTATVSRLRAEVTGAVVAPAAVSAKGTVVTTFVPQIAAAHRRVLGWIGIDPDAGASETAAGAWTESMVTNPRGLWMLEAMEALAEIFGAAAVGGEGDQRLRERVDMYRKRASAERARAAARIDADGDGVGEIVRRLHAGSWERG